jgi:DNA polymerase III delta subunit
MIASPSLFERRWIIEKGLGIKARFLRASTTTPSELAVELSTPSLFRGGEWIVYDEIEKVKKSLKELSVYPQLILSGTRVEKGAFMTLDLTREKPWEKKDRLRDFAIREMQMRGKQILSDAAAYLVEMAQGDMAHLHQEIEKLAIYACDKERIDLQTVQDVSSGDLTQNPWTLSESIALEGKYPQTLPFTDTSGFHKLMGQLRYHYRVGLQLSQGEAVSGLRPKTADKYTRLAQKRGPAYFQKGLEALFQTELKAKTTSIDPKILYTHMLAEMHI